MGHREFERAEASLKDKPIPGDTAPDRVIYVLRKTTRGLQGDPHLTEALTRAFMFADASVATEIHAVGMQLSTMLTKAMDPERTEPTNNDITITHIINNI